MIKKPTNKQLVELDFDLDEEMLENNAVFCRSNSVRGLEKIKFYELNFAPLIRPKNHGDICPSPMTLLNRNLGMNDSFQLYEGSSQ
jgi:hypothetical protein